VAAPVVVLDLELAVLMLLADVTGGVVSPVAGKRGAGGTGDERTGDQSGGDETTNRHWISLVVAIVHSSGKRVESNIRRWS
jgi:hypothetical protein